MTDQEVLLDLFATYAAGVRRTISGMSHAALTWQPDAEANNISVTVWHMSRALDLLKVRLLENRPALEELWFTSQWVQRTGYDPRGLGWSGFGNLTGYTTAEVAAVPLLSADDLLLYFDQTVGALITYLRAMPHSDLYQPAVGWPQSPQPVAYEVLKSFLMDGIGHVGEIRAIKAMWDRRTKTL